MKSGWWLRGSERGAALLESLTGVMRVHSPTIIVVHPKERRSKCSVEPLRAREDFVFWKWPSRGKESLANYVRLGIGGRELSAEDASRGLLVLDGTWKLASRMEPDYHDVPVRGLPRGWRTAYPRVSKLTEDPSEGLATIEAIYAAYCALGWEREGLLDAYYWREDFLRLNTALLPEK